MSYHCIVETSYEVPDYKLFWHHINNKYFGGRADNICAHPSVWTRTPGVIRPDTEKIQCSCLNVNRVFDPTEELAEMEATHAKNKIESLPVQVVIQNPKNRKDVFAQAVRMEMERKMKQANVKKIKSQAQELLNGIFPSDGFQEWGMTAINCLHGFNRPEVDPAFRKSPEEIWKLLAKAGKDKSGKDRRDKVKTYVFRDRKN